MKQRTSKKSKDVRRQSDIAESEAPRKNPNSIAAWFSRSHNWLLAAALATTVFLAYQPAWHGALIWDDDAHLSRPEMQSWHGLYRIWFDLKATQQYYPLLHSVFWFEYWLWGRDTLGYHLVNIFLHTMAAILVAVILRRLAIPGAYLAAAVFALHPVQVESVAWITELKNTLSAVFYLSAALVYLGFDQRRKGPLYAGALGLFVLGLLSKTTTATLPAALLVVFWWQRGRLSWRRDVLPLVPFFVLGAAAGLFTAWVERVIGGAQGGDFNFTVIERCLIAGRAIWFYLSKLFWPADLTFIYPRWHVSQGVWWQYLFPVGALMLLAGLWSVRRRWRGPLAAMLFFIGTLFPVLGFFNVYPFRFSFVADHFQYLASLGVITLTSAGVAILLDRWKVWGRWPAYGLCGVLLLVLALRTWTQCWMYTEIDRLYLTTIERNPNCWMAYNNLGLLFFEQGEYDKAVECYNRTIGIKPEYVEGHLNLGATLNRLGELDLAMAQYRTALAIGSDSAEAHFGLGNVFLAKKELDKAIGEYQAALAIRQDFIEARCNLGNALTRRGKTAEATVEYRKVLEVNPNHPGAHCNLANALLVLGQYDEAISEYRKALAVRPDFPEARQNLDTVLAHLDEIKAEKSQQKPDKSKP